MSEKQSFYAPCARGLEPLLDDELRRLRIRGVRPQRSGVLFTGRLPDVYRALLWSRFASRILLSLGDADATSADGLYEAAHDIPWEDHIRPSGTIAVDAVGMNAALRNTQFTAVRVKDAIADRLRERFGERPSVDTSAPDVRVNVVVGESRARLSIDLSGDALHRRGYREQGVQVAAPMKETLAAAVLGFGGWPQTAAAGGAFLDPLCGSGTLAIEAAWMAGDVAPGILRARWGFERWLGHDAAAWDALVGEADERCEAGLEKLVPIAASDSDPAAIEIARACVRRAGLDKHVVLSVSAVADAAVPAGAATGLVACNPPYGERLSDRRDLPSLYRDLSVLMRERCDGYGLAIITSDESLERGLGVRAARTHELFNGRIPAKAYVFDSANGWAAPSASAGGADPSVEAFANRLRKMAKHFGTWARRTGVSCYRVYDADLPDFNVAIDVYGAAGDEGRTWIHLAEYAPPADIDPRRAAERLDLAAEVSAEVFGVPRDAVFVKRREKQRGSAQYERVSQSSVTGIIAEGGLHFEINLSDYLDTGLFLDHRETRAWVRELAGGKRFLNLFAYTGSVSAYAAAGGAASTTTVDLSQTYLDWARRNLERNGFSGNEHRLVRADVLTWIGAARERGERFDLIFCDPPTFSNSKRMDDTWDVQRDHAELLSAVAELLAEDGTIIFSCNRRKFVLDEEALASAGLAVRDVTRRTTPKDFDRTPPAHHCWTIRRA
ncbi:MAG: bifunctional 23S rRNA (guanine(2069)-N(7))-methyltransferase RlmK/23S rRNA (guanine(2445)-N(2))-methyltransferase RlmL [Coriobacteriia bacterium]|nr:bifunctional 23S rRNA (guanine(2069)-N(7))-methyltransferase RlmK/23S rRNA (guanine(2445)-N(2))-methyltransferase RlmL [Coriobacteriia bacterium]